MIRVGFKKITREYTNFLQNLRKKSNIFNNLEELHPFPKEMRKLIEVWLKEYINTINLSITKTFNNSSLVNKSLSELKEEYDKILQTGTSTLLLGKSPEIVTKGISAFEIFSAYHEFLNAGLCKELKKEDIDRIIMENETSNVKKFKPKIEHYNRWFTNRIQNYLKNLDFKVKFLFEPYISFSEMDNLFGLGKGYILGRRMKNKSKHIIAKSILNTMRENLNDHITNWIKKFPALKRHLFDIEKDIKKFIDDYEEFLKPKPTPRYQMYLHHTNFNRHYFSLIDSKEKAYWLGFLFADGYIALEHKKSENYYRMGIGLSSSDRNVLVKFCRNVGLNPDYIKDRIIGSDFSNNQYQMSSIRWGDQKFAKDLINLGMEYEYNTKKGRRAKVPTLPILKKKEFMLAFLLGFYDGDGTLGYNADTGRIYPSLASSRKVFLQQIKDYFGIKPKIKSRVSERYNLRKKIIQKVQASELSITAVLFENMLLNYKDSMKRKRIELDFFKGYHEQTEKFSPKRPQLIEILSKDVLVQILEVISPSKIAQLLNVSNTTIFRFMKDYEITRHKKGYYASINNDINLNGKTSKYYKQFIYWTDFIQRLIQSTEK